MKADKQRKVLEILSDGELLDPDEIAQRSNGVLKVGSPLLPLDIRRMTGGDVWTVLFDLRDGGLVDERRSPIQGSTVENVAGFGIAEAGRVELARGDGYWKEKSEHERRQIVERFWSVFGDVWYGSIYVLCCRWAASRWGFGNVRDFVILAFIFLQIRRWVKNDPPVS